MAERLTDRTEATTATDDDLLHIVTSSVSKKIKRKNLVELVFGFACSDETTDLTTGTKHTIYLPISLANISVAACVVTAPTGASLITDIHFAGTTIMTTNKLEIDATENTTNTAATPPAVTTTTYTAYDKIEFIIDQIGSTVAGAGLKVFIMGTKG